MIFLSYIPSLASEKAFYYMFIGVNSFSAVYLSESTAVYSGLFVYSFVSLDSLALAI